MDYIEAYLFIVFLNSAILVSFIAGINDSKKAFSLAIEAQEQDTSSNSLVALRESVMSSFSFKTFLRFNSKTMRVPEDEQNFLSYFNDVFLPGNKRILSSFSGLRSKLLLGFAALVITATPIVVVAFLDDWAWLAWLGGAVLLIVLTALFYILYGELVRKERDYAEVIEQVSLKLIALKPPALPPLQPKG